MESDQQQPKTDQHVRTSNDATPETEEADFVQQLSESKRQRLRELYEELDVDKNGRIDVKELLAALNKRFSNIADTAGLAEEIVKRADTSADEALDFNEFVGYVLEHERNLAVTFDALDKNKDGVIDFREVKRHLLELGFTRITDAQAKSIIKRMTSQGSNTIGLEEFQRHFLLHPTASAEEIAKYWHRGLFIDIGEGAVIPQIQNRADWWKPLVSGGVAGAISRTATAPLDRLKTFLQVHASHTNQLGVFSGLRYLMKEGGLKALWRGNGVNVAKIVPESAIKFWAYEQAKLLIAGDGDANEIGGGARFLAGSAAGTFSQTVIYPMEVLKTRLALRKTGEMDHGMLDAFRTVYRNEGLRAFGRGYTPNLIGIIPYAGTELAAYETLKNLCVEHYFEDTDPGLLVVLACGILSSTVAQVVSYPLALVRTRLQAHTSKQPDTMLGQFSHILRQDGFAGLYRGLVPNFLKVLPSAGVGYIAYEMVGKWLDGVSK